MSKQMSVLSPICNVETNTDISSNVTHKCNMSHPPSDIQENITHAVDIQEDTNHEFNFDDTHSHSTTHSPNDIQDEPLNTCTTFEDEYTSGF